MSVYLYTYVYMYVYMHICIYTCTHIYIYIYWLVPMPLLSGSATNKTNKYQKIKNIEVRFGGSILIMCRNTCAHVRSCQ